jgi:hypothetical protein
MRRTSIEAYMAIKESGQLSKCRLEAYEVLFHHGPLTATEVTVRHGVSNGWKRLSELKRFGVILETGVRPCSVTGHNATLWDVTDSSQLDLGLRPAKKNIRTCPHCGGAL